MGNRLEGKCGIVVRNSIELGWRCWSIVGVTSSGPGADLLEYACMVD